MGRSRITRKGLIPKEKFNAWKKAKEAKETEDRNNSLFGGYGQFLQINNFIYQLYITPNMSEDRNKHGGSQSDGAEHIDGQLPQLTDVIDPEVFKKLKKQMKESLSTK